MADDNIQKHPIKKVDDIGPASPDNPIVTVLERNGVLISETRSLRFKVADQDLESKYKGYIVFLTGARPNEDWPRTKKSFTDARGEIVIECWQIVIHWREKTCLEARWSVERRDFQVVLARFQLANLSPQVVEHLNGALELLLWLQGQDQMRDVKRGGPHHVKTANQPKHIKEALGARYVELLDELKTAKQDAKTFYRIEGDCWRSKFLEQYPIFKTLDDLLRDVDPVAYFIDGDRIYDQWEIAIEIAAREKIPGYGRKSVSPRTLKNHAILPDNNTD